jgi:hypothetical protein
LRIAGFDLFEHADSAALGRLIGGMDDEIERGFYVGGGERAAVMEFHVGL